MSELPALAVFSTRSTVAGLCAVSRARRCNTHAAFAATVWTSSRTPRRRATTELHDAGGGILLTVRATRASARKGIRRSGRAPRGPGCVPPARRRSRRRSRIRVDKEDRLASLRVIRTGRPIPTWLGATAVPPEFDDARLVHRYLPSPSKPEAAQTPRRTTSSSSAVPSTRAGAPLPRGVRDAGLALRLHGDQFKESGAIPLSSSSVRRLRRPPRERRRRDKALAGGGRHGVLSGASALSPFDLHDAPAPLPSSEPGRRFALARTFKTRLVYSRKASRSCVPRRDSAPTLPRRRRWRRATDMRPRPRRADRIRGARARLPARTRAPRRNRLRYRGTTRRGVVAEDVVGGELAEQG